MKDEIKKIKEIISNFLERTLGVTFIELDRELNKHGIDTNGDYDFMFPEEDIKGKPSKNTYLWVNMSEDYYTAMVELLKENKIIIKVISPMIYAFDGGMLSMPFAKKNKFYYDEPHWLPITLCANKKYCKNTNRRK